MQIFYQGDKRIMTFNEDELKQYEKISYYMIHNPNINIWHHHDLYKNIINQLPSEIDFFTDTFTILCIKYLALAFDNFNSHIEFSVPNIYQSEIDTCLRDGAIFEIYCRILNKIKFTFPAISWNLKKEISLIPYYESIISLIKSNFKEDFSHSICELD